MPKKYDILYLSIAERDLTDIFEYIYKDNPSVAASFLNTGEFVMARFSVETIAKLME